MIVGIEDDQIGVAAGCDRAFAWKEAEELGGSGTERIDEAVYVETSDAHSMCVHEVNTFFDARNAVWNLREGSRSKLFLVQVERAMVGAHRVDHACFKGSP